jgi:hypothetical protein
VTNVNEAKFKGLEGIGTIRMQRNKQELEGKCQSIVKLFLNFDPCENLSQLRFAEVSISLCSMETCTNKC